MKQRRYTAWPFLFLLFNLACAKTVYNHRYFPKQAFPKMIYVEDQVQRLKTKADIPDEKQIYIEVETKAGIQETGRLIRMTEQDLVLSRGFYYSTVKDSTLRIENKIAIPKQDILILKIW
jgi:hypothetical protein